MADTEIVQEETLYICNANSQYNVKIINFIALSDASHTSLYLWISLLLGLYFFYGNKNL
jgi:hypothetical protein